MWSALEKNAPQRGVIFSQGSSGDWKEFREINGKRLCLRVASPELPPRGGVIMIHGLGDYSERYVPLLGRFVERGFAVAMADFPGHGESGGRRGHIEGLDEGFVVVEALREILLQQIGIEGPLVLGAHSMGAFVGLQYLARNPGQFRRAWLSSPLIRPSYRKALIKQFLVGKLAARYPSFTIHSGVRRSQCVSAGEGSREGAAPMGHHRVSFQLGAALLEAERRMDEVAATLDPSLDLLVTQGSADRVCPARFTREFLQKADLSQMRYREFEGALHEPLFDPEFKGEATAAVVGWLSGAEPAPPFITP